MPRIQPTAIETHDAQHPGLRQQVEMYLDQNTPLQIIAQNLHQTFNVVVPEKTISNYKQRRWLPARLRINALTEQTEAIMDIVRRHGANDITMAYILEELADAKERNEKAPVEVLLREQRARAQLQIAQQLADLEKRRVTLEHDRLQIQIDKFKEERRQIAEIAQRAIETETSTTTTPWSREAAMARIRSYIGEEPEREPTDPKDEAMIVINHVIGIGGQMVPRTERTAPDDDPDRANKN